MLLEQFLRLARWMAAHAGLVAAVVTVAIALLVYCGVECCHCSKRDDELFRRRSV